MPKYKVVMLAGAISQVMEGTVRHVEGDRLTVENGTLTIWRREDDGSKGLVKAFGPNAWATVEMEG